MVRSPLALLLMLETYYVSKALDDSGDTKWLNRNRVSFRTSYASLYTGFIKLIKRFVKVVLSVKNPYGVTKMVSRKHFIKVMAYGPIAWTYGRTNRGMRSRLGASTEGSNVSKWRTVASHLSPVNYLSPENSAICIEVATYYPFSYSQTTSELDIMRFPRGPSGWFNSMRQVGDIIDDARIFHNKMEALYKEDLAYIESFSPNKPVISFSNIVDVADMSDFMFKVNSKGKGESV